MRCLSVFIFVFSLVGLPFSQEPAGAGPENGKSEVSAMGADKLADEYGIPADSVRYLKERYDIGYGGISRALALAGRSGRAVEEILRMKTQEKKGWDLIAGELNIEPNDAYPQTDDLEQGPAPAAQGDGRQVKMEKAMARAERKNNRRHGRK
jgi:hypothetical protein